MGKKIVKERLTQSPQVQDAWGSFTTGAGAVNPTVPESWGVLSVLRTGTGAYEITFEEAAKFYCFDHSVIWNTAAQSVICTAVNPTTKKVNLLIVGAGGATPADVTGLRVDFTCAQRQTN